MIGFVALAIALLAIVRFACQYGRRMLAGRLSLDVQHDLRLALLGSLQRLDGRGQDQIRTGQVYPGPSPIYNSSRVARDGAHVRGVRSCNSCSRSASWRGSRRC